MICENYFCVYWSKNVCVLDEITLDIQGNCQNCIYLNIPKKILAKKRKKVLKRYQEEYDEFKKSKLPYRDNPDTI